MLKKRSYYCVLVTPKHQPNKYPVKNTKRRPRDTDVLKHKNQTEHGALIRIMHKINSRNAYNNMNKFTLLYLKLASIKI